MGGGTWQSQQPKCCNTGLSPRGRGNPCTSAHNRYVLRSIPAWAGEPVRSSYTKPTKQVYPRVGGGTLCFAAWLWQAWGLSPRGRGNPEIVPVTGNRVRSIPAWAGEPALPLALPAAWGVYPRVGGGTVYRCQRSRLCIGLSPRGRGNPYLFTKGLAAVRSIPAWAGEPKQPLAVICCCRVYPRVGGGTYMPRKPSR